MQPYFLPYIGYWQLMNEVDILVISDDTKYVKQSWINRNVIWIQGERRYLTLPIAKAGDNERINQRLIAPTFKPEDLQRKVIQDYRACKRPEIEDFFWEIFGYPSRDLTSYLKNSIKEIVKLLGISTEIILASSFGIPGNLVKQERIFFTAKYLGEKTYTNLPGGKSIYSSEEFNARSINLEFIHPNLSPYQTKINSFYPSLSILDLLFQAESFEVILNQINDYSIEN
jgi:hypothetical protein